MSGGNEYRDSRKLSECHKRDGSSASEASGQGHGIKTRVGWERSAGQGHFLTTSTTVIGHRDRNCQEVRDGGNYAAENSIEVIGLWGVVSDLAAVIIIASAIERVHGCTP